MSIVTGEITNHGPIIVILVGVSENRRLALQRLHMHVPEQVPIRALIDTGSFVTGMMPEVFTQLGITPFAREPVRSSVTKRGEPHSCPLYNVSVSFVSGTNLHPFHSLRVIEGDFCPGEEVEGIIGRDLLCHCVLTYTGPDKHFQIAF